MNVVIQRGIDALTIGDGHEALEVFTRAINDSTRDAAAFYGRAKAHLLLKDRPKAIADYDAAIRMEPRNLQYRIERATELYKQRQFDSAIADCDAGLALEADHAELIGLRGKCHLALGNSAAALADFDRAGPAFAAIKAQLLKELGDCERESGPPSTV